LQERLPILVSDLCPRLKALKDRRLFLRRGMPIPASVQTLARRTSLALGKYAHALPYVIALEMGGPQGRHSEVKRCKARHSIGISLACADTADIVPKVHHQEIT
jgi:hypothetical protein